MIAPAARRKPAGEAALLVAHAVTTLARRRELENGLVDVPLMVLAMEAASLEDGHRCQAPRNGGELRFGVIADLIDDHDLDVLLRGYALAFDISDAVVLVIASKRRDEQTLLTRAKATAPEPGRRPLVEVLSEEQEPGDAEWWAGFCDIFVSVSTDSSAKPELLAALAHLDHVVSADVGGHLGPSRRFAATPVACEFAAIGGDGRTPQFRASAESVEVALLAAAKRRPTRRGGAPPASEVDRRAAPARTSYAVAARAVEERTAWLTSWNTKCGIASHAANQLASVKGAHLVLAPTADDRIGVDAANVLRCWASGKAPGALAGVLDEIDERGITTLVVHFNYGFYNFADLSALLQEAARRRIVTFIELHSTQDPQGMGTGWRLTELTEGLRACDRVLVHSQSDMRRLSSLGVKDNVVLFPLGVVQTATGPRVRPPSTTPLVATFGYCLPNKGLKEFILALWLMKQRGATVQALMLNAEYPAPISIETVGQLRELINALDMSESIDLNTAYLSDDMCVEALATADLIVNPYQNTSESSSAAINYAMAARRPLLVTPLEIFADLGEAVFRSGGVRPEQLASAITETLRDVKADSPLAARRATAAAAWLRTHNIGTQTAGLMRLARIIRRNRELKADPIASSQ